MALQILPQMQWGQPRSWSGGGGSRRSKASADAGIDRAIKLEELDKLKSERETRTAEKEAGQEAVAEATTVESQAGYTLNLPDGSTEEASVKKETVDPQKAMDNYGFMLAKNPKTQKEALAYNTLLTQHREREVKVQSDILKLELDKKGHDLALKTIELGALNKGLDYFDATGDAEGALTFFAAYDKDPKNRAVGLTRLANGNILLKQADGDVHTIDKTKRQFLNVSEEQQLKSHIDLLQLAENRRQFDEKAKTDKDKAKAKAVPRDATIAERKDMARWLENDSLGKFVTPQQRELMGAELAQSVIDIQTAQKNAGETPDDQEVARSKAVNKMARRTLPPKARAGGWWFDSPARYFTSKEAVKAAKENGDIDQGEHDYLMKGFDAAPDNKEPPKEVKDYTKPDEIKEAVKSGKLSKEEGIKILKEKFGYK